MKAMLKMAVISLLVFTLVVPGIGFAEESSSDSMHHGEKKCANVELSREQQQHLDELHKKLFKDKKELVKTLAEYGVITKQQKEKHLKWMKKHLQKAKGNPDFWCHHGKKYKKHDED